MPNAEKQKKSKPTRKTQKINLESWLVIANILVTAIVGIYLSIRNENLQQQIFKWQSQAGLAEIQITQDDPAAQSANGNIRIKNTGLATAKDLRIIICLQDADMSISDIKDFEIIVNNPSIIYKVEGVKRNCGMFGYAGIDNAFLISLENLPPNQSFDFYVQVSFSKPYSFLTFKTKMYLALPKDSFSGISDYPFDNSINDALQRYMSNKLSAAYLELSASCENCVVESDNFVFIVSTMERNSWGNFQVSDNNSKVAPGYIEVSFDADTTYRSLENSVFTPMQNLYLSASYLSDGLANISDADKNKFSIFNP